jgi:hypothetical protein
MVGSIYVVFMVTNRNIPMSSSGVQPHISSWSTLFKLSCRLGMKSVGRDYADICMLQCTSKDLNDELIANNCKATDALIYDIFLHCHCGNLRPV